MTPHPFRLPLPSPFRLSAALAAAAIATITTVTLMADSAFAGSSPAPLASPGGNVPSHAAGGWPSDTTGDDKKPARTPEQQARLDAVTNELKRLADQYGPDSVILQSKLLIRTMTAGAIGPTEVKVAGPSTAAGSDHLEVDIETGLYFDEKTTTAESRRDQVWKDVAQPVLDEMLSFKIEPASLELVLLFDVQDVSTLMTTAPDPTAPSRHEAFRARLGRPLLEDLISDRVVGDAAREKVQFSPSLTVAKPERVPEP